MSDGRRLEVADEEDLAALVALAGLPGLGPNRFWHLVGAARPADVWRDLQAGRVDRSGRSGDPSARWPAYAAGVDSMERLAAHRAAGVDVFWCGGPGWPARLCDDPHPPVVLFSAGPAPVDRPMLVSVVGTRRCTRYGRDVAAELGARLAGAGVAVVSGLAHGIDAAAHAGAARSNPASLVAVVAGGPDVVYPRGNRELHSLVRADGVLLSEWPMGSPAQRWRFPARNRLVAALSDACIVVESPERGGSMYTVDEALRRDRLVAAVPGNIRSPASAGTNRLIADGAEPVVSVDHLLERLGVLTGDPGRSVRSADASPDSWLLPLVEWEPVSIDVLASRSGRGPLEVMAEVERLVALRVIERRGAVVERIAVGTS